ncbi:MAG: T9SS type A sorting domain-containing protein [Bacteroidales bacterium]|nr:T9SS type A sorting domain-containing protein [Bacteroidales bacterium]
MLQLEKRIAQGLIPPSRIEIERANCPMFQEPSEEQTKSFQNNSSEINIESYSWIKIIPNPASQQFTLCVNSESENPCEVEITNILGKHVETISVAKGYSERVVSLDKYSKGIYIASLVKNGKKVAIQRFSVVK